MSLNPGARLGAYEVVTRLGAGAMGEVYRARDTRLGREVALKILPAEFAANADRRRRFEQESRSASALTHPNIVAVYDVGDQDGVSYIVSELVDGESLRDLMDRGPVPLRKTIDLGAQIADGLAAAHAAGIVHRDLKPENVMLTRDGRPKILDFGLARYQPAEPAAGTVTMTQPGMVMGTAGYMSPEQVAGAPADARSDIFSLGIMLHEMLAGSLPFARPTTIETMSAILRDDPVDLPPALSPALRQVILHCLEKEPARRFQSANDLAFNLRAVAPGSTTGSSAGSVAGMVVGTAPARVRPRLPILTIALGLIAAAAIVILLLRPTGGVDLAAYRFTPLAADAQSQHSAAWSPDGKNLAYVRDVAGREDQVMVRSLSSPVPTVVATVNDPHSLFWSRDSARVYFAASDGVWSVSRGGGEKQQVVKGNYYAATLSPDGKTMALWLLMGDGNQKEPKLWISSPPGAAPRRYEPVVIESNGSFTPVFLRFSPDGKQILVSMTMGGGPHLWLLPYPDGAAASGKPHQILEAALAGAEIPRVDWMPDSRRIVLGFSSDSHPQSQIWMADTHSQKMAPLTVGENDRAEPAVSPDGKQIAFDSSDMNFDIVGIPVGGGVVEPMLSTSRNDLFPAWSPKGSFLAYITDRTGHWEIWLRSSEEQAERPLITQHDFPDDQTLELLTPAVSPDGTRIAFSRISNKHVGELWLSPISGGAPLRIGGAKGYEIGPNWSPDGKSIVYFSSETGVSKISVGSSDPPVSLGQSSGCENPPQWSPDGAWIACGTEKGVVLLSPDGKTQRTVGHRRAFVAWSRDGKQIYALGHVEDGKWRFSAIDPASGNERTIADYGPETEFASPFNPSFPLSLSPDGKTLATSIVNRRSDIWMLEGFEKK